MRWPGWTMGLGACWLLGTTGCPSNTCFLTVNGRCKWSSCPDGAQFDNAKRSCSCEPGRIPLNGGCLTLEAANQYCGKGSHFENGGCAQNRCPAGLTIDQDTGYCMTPQQATEVANNMGVKVGQNQQLGCQPGEQLVVEGGQAACVPIRQTCGRDEVWDGAACRKAASCPIGSAIDPTTNTCVKFTTSADAKEYAVDLPAWMRTSYGPDGGAGTNGFCGAFNKHPLAFGVRAGSSLRVKIAVHVQAPDNEIGRASVATIALTDPAGQLVAAKGAGEVLQAAQAILAPLVLGGGKSNANAAQTTVNCVIVNASLPTAVSVSGGL